ncbi:ATP-dependent DNA ligase [Candidatus Woesearchaeota archaeon B3_Woes]|nr:MAG: ATP-dependent DNA ligase [Candidatus Woesearchaeota archaeon B3_Woes]
MVKKLKYVIQKHDASHLHYDLRLEIDNVARSWAIPKEPSSKEGVKRLAILVEDHSVEYMDFEGKITEGYGKGSVKIWDKGFWEPESVKENKIVAIIHGKKLKGRFTLVHFKEKNWLFFKAKG